MSRITDKVPFAIGLTLVIVAVITFASIAWWWAFTNGPAVTAGIVTSIIVIIGLIILMVKA